MNKLMKSRLFWVAVLSGLLALVVMESKAVDYSILVPASTSYKIAPRHPVKTALAWEASAAVAQGDYRENIKRVYMAVHAGTTGSTAPTHVSGIVSDGTVLWLRVEKSRVSLSITTEGEGSIWYHDNVATTNGGVYGYMKGQQYYEAEYQGEVFVVVETELKLNIKERR